MAIISFRLEVNRAHDIWLNKTDVIPAEEAVS